MSLKKFFKTKKWKSKQESFSKEIESKLYKSDLWLKDNVQDILTKEDSFNCPTGPYIPDLINNKYRYIIECDGSVHDLESVKIRDKKNKISSQI